MITIGVESDEEEAAVIAAMADGSLEAALGRGFVIRKSGAGGVGYILPAGQGCGGGGSGDVTISGGDGSANAYLGGGGSGGVFPR